MLRWDPSRQTVAYAHQEAAGADLDLVTVLDGIPGSWEEEQARGRLRPRTTRSARMTRVWRPLCARRSSSSKEANRVSVVVTVALAQDVALQ